MKWIPATFLKAYQGKDIPSFSPIDGKKIGSIKSDTSQSVKQKIAAAQKAQKDWAQIPMPGRGRLIGILGDVLRRHKKSLADLVTLECGKIQSEALGEVQEMIDMCDLAVGLSRQIGGQIFPSELPEHNLEERWHPKGVVGIITAFNFPVAVWAWNFCLSLLCGNANLWKPSEKTPFCALACQYLWEVAVKEFAAETKIKIAASLNQIILGDATIGAMMVSNPKIAMISATGSCRMGVAIQQQMAKDLGRSCLLELGGNNAVIVTAKADLAQAIPSILFGAIGTAGQRCTTTRRLLVEKSLYADLCTFLREAYQKMGGAMIGDPRRKETLLGPLIDEHAFTLMQDALAKAKKQGGKITGGKRVKINEFGGGAFYVTPALVEMTKQNGVVMEETFAPILYVMPFQNLEDAMKMNNAAAQGLSSAIFTKDLGEAEYFLRHSDTGIANVNNGTSGAELGGAFGGNKETGGGREAGSDSWKAYMNRSTNRIHYGDKAPALAQGVSFPIRLDQKQLSNITAKATKKK